MRVRDFALRRARVARDKIPYIIETEIILAKKIIRYRKRLIDAVNRQRDNARSVSIWGDAAMWQLWQRNREKSRGSAEVSGREVYAKIVKTKKERESAQLHHIHHDKLSPWACVRPTWVAMETERKLRTREFPSPRQAQVATMSFRSHSLPTLLVSLKN